MTDEPSATSSDLIEGGLLFWWRVTSQNLWILASDNFGPAAQASVAEDVLRAIAPGGAEPLREDVAALAGELAEQISRFVALVKRHEKGAIWFDDSEKTPEDLRDVPSIDGMLWLDALAAEHLEGMGESQKKETRGRQWAQAIREQSPSRLAKFKGVPFPGEQMTLAQALDRPDWGARWEEKLASYRELWKLWHSEARPPEIAFLLAEVAWYDIVAPRLEARKYPALALGAYRPIDRSLWSASRRRDGRRVVFDKDGRQGLLFLDEERVAPIVVGEDPEGELQAPAIQADLADCFQATLTVTCVRLVRYLIIEAYRKKFLLGDRSPERFVFEGGFQALAKELGITGGKGADEIRKALKAGQAVHVQWPTGEFGGLWMWVLDRSAPGKPARLKITVNEPLLPDYAFKIPKRRREDRQLIPVLEGTDGKPYLPPRIGSPQAHLRQVRLADRVLERLRRYAGELSKSGTVRITQETWAAMAAEVGLKPEDVEPLVERWLREPEQFLERRGVDRYTLADAHRRALATLLAGAKKQIEGARRQARGKRTPGR